MTKRIWVGIDVGVETASLCVIDGSGEILQQATCASAARAVHREIHWIRRYRHAHVGLEAGGGTSLARGLRSLGYCVELYETRQLSKFLTVRRNKTDADDARGIAEAGRLAGSLISRVYLKSLECQALQSRLVIRRHLIRERVAAVSLLCRQVELYGGRVAGPTAVKLRAKVEAEIRKLFNRSPNPIVSDLLSLLGQCERLAGQQQVIDREVERLALAHEVSRRLMEVPGVGPVCALTFAATVGDPNRFGRSSDIGSYFGLTPRLRQSGLKVRPAHISRMGNKAMRALLVRSALIFMKAKRADPAVRDWALAIERRSGRGTARVALARKLAVIMLAMWKRDEHYRLRPTPRTPPQAAAPETSGGAIGGPGVDHSAAGANLMVAG